VETGDTEEERVFSRKLSLMGRGGSPQGLQSTDCRPIEKQIRTARGKSSYLTGIERLSTIRQIQPTVNADQMKLFKKKDKAFHKALKGLLKAAKTDDLEKATKQFGQLMNGCTSCHTTFRFK
jgi:hypothetical protein